MQSSEVTAEGNFKKSAYFCEFENVLAAALFGTVCWLKLFPDLVKRDAI
jgi:hypothetical protein